MGIYRYNNEEEKWEDTSKFKLDDKMRLVFWFPRVAYYNTFKFDIVYDDDDKVIVSDTLYWSGSYLTFDYNIAPMVEAANNADSYRIRLWNGNRIAFEKKIKVKFE